MLKSLLETALDREGDEQREATDAEVREAVRRLERREGRRGGRQY